MIIDLFPTQNSPSGSGKDGSQQGNVALINGVIEAGKAMVSYEAACTMLMELVPIVAANKKAMAFDTAKLRRFSAGCFFFYVFLPSLCDHINEFWPKLRSSVRVLAKRALFEDKNMYFECVGVVTSDVRRRSLHLGDHRLGARHGHRDRQDHQGLDHRRYSWLRRRGSDDR